MLSKVSGPTKTRKKGWLFLGVACCRMIEAGGLVQHSPSDLSARKELAASSKFVMEHVTYVLAASANWQLTALREGNHCNCNFVAHVTRWHVGYYMMIMKMRCGQ